MSATDLAPQLVCVPSAIPAAERQAHFALARELFEQRAIAREVLPNGYSLHLPPDALEEVARFVSNERRCCPFMTFEIAVASDGAPILLRLTGPEGTRGIIDAELNLDSCSSRGCCG
jgi:hypothetical protein